VTQYLLDLQPGLSVVLAKTTSGNTDRFVHGPTGIHAQKDTAGSWEWMIQDGLGSVRGVASNPLAMLESRQYSPYGMPFGMTGANQTPFGFTGEPTDANTLLYLRARYYAPGLGAFTARDPLKGMAQRPMSLNGYMYVEGDPVNTIDASGMQLGTDFVAAESDPYSQLEALSYRMVNGVQVEQLPYGGRSRVPEDARVQFYALDQYRKQMLGTLDPCHSREDASITYEDLLATVIGGEFGTLRGVDFNNSVEAMGRWYYDYTETTGSSGQVLNPTTINPEPGFQDLELWIFLGNVHSFYSSSVSQLYGYMIDERFRQKAREILAGSTNESDITSGFNNYEGRPINWGNPPTLGDPARERLRTAAQAGRLTTNTSGIGTYYQAEQEYDYAVWAYVPLGEYVLWSPSQQRCLMHSENDGVTPTSGCRVCPNRNSSYAECHSNY
jgi:RHS repeat-associated protein